MTVLGHWQESTKIVEESGGIINQDRVSVAQDEMDVLSTITEENKDKEGYSDEALNAAQEQAKTELAAQTADDSGVDSIRYSSNC